LFSLDGKFWNTLIPLLIKPGLISRNYIDGKRQRYSNPFRFYLTASILFFLILGLSKSIDKFEAIKEGTPKKKSAFVSLSNSKTDKKTKKVDADSLKNAVNIKDKNSGNPLDSIKRKKNMNPIAEEANDSISILAKNKIKKNQFRKIKQYLQFQKEHPEINLNDALDSLQKEKTFFNRFVFNRAKVINSLIDETETQEQFISQLLSYGSASLFVFLPFFTLFLKLFYVRRKYTYIDHLVFVFHTQTIFFILLSVYFLIVLLGAKPQLWLFISLFLIYLLIAMHKFYKQGYIKTLIKFLMLNFVYLIMGTIGVLLVGLISFAIY
jgi:hypothetical protein